MVGRGIRGAGRITLGLLQVIDDVDAVDDMEIGITNLAMDELPRTAEVDDVDERAPVQTMEERRALRQKAEMEKREVLADDVDGECCCGVSVTETATVLFATSMLPGFASAAWPSDDDVDSAFECGVCIGASTLSSKSNSNVGDDDVEVDFV